MHEGIHPECAECLHFVLAFHTDSPLADWGYCLIKTDGQELPKAQLREIEVEARQGNLQRLKAGELGLYELGDWGCEKFESFHPF